MACSLVCVFLYVVNISLLVSVRSEYWFACFCRYCLFICMFLNILFIGLLVSERLAYFLHVSLHSVHVSLLVFICFSVSFYIRFQLFL